MAQDENAHIVANPSAAGTDWGVSWCARECLYSSKSGRRRHRMEGEGAAGTDWQGRTPQAADGGGVGRGLFPPPTTQGRCSGYLSCRVKSYCKGIATRRSLV